MRLAIEAIRCCVIMIVLVCVFSFLIRFFRAAGTADLTWGNAGLWVWLGSFIIALLDCVRHYRRARIGL